MPASTRKTRVCTLCAREDIKQLGDHLKNKHKLLSAKERAPHLKRSLMIQKAREANDGNDSNVEHNNAVKRADTVCEEPNDTARRDAIAEFREQERILSANFQQIEDHIVTLRLKAMRTVHSAMSMERVRMDVRKKLMPLYEMVMKSLETSLCDITPPAQLKRTNEHRSVRSPEPKRKKKLVSKQHATGVEVDDATVRSSAAGMDFLENGLVRCQTCRMSWNASMSCECLCGYYYNGPDRANLNTKGTYDTGLDFLENGLVRCRACHFEWDGNAQHECAYDADSENSNL